MWSSSAILKGRSLVWPRVSTKPALRQWALSTWPSGRMALKGRALPQTPWCCLQARETSSGILPLRLSPLTPPPGLGHSTGFPLALPLPCACATRRLHRVTSASGTVSRSGSPGLPELEGCVASSPWPLGRKGWGGSDCGFPSLGLTPPGLPREPWLHKWGTAPPSGSSAEAAPPNLADTGPAAAPAPR